MVKLSDVRGVAGRMGSFFRAVHLTRRRRRMFTAGGLVLLLIATVLLFGRTGGDPVIIVGYAGPTTSTALAQPAPVIEPTTETLAPHFAREPGPAVGLKVA